MVPKSAMVCLADITHVKAAVVVVKALHAEAAWDAAGPRPTRGARRGTRGRRAPAHHLSAGQCLTLYLVKEFIIVYLFRVSYICR